MCCTTLIALETTMATTRFMRADCFESCRPSKDEKTPEQKQLRMSWVVVTDENGNRELRMQWRATLR